VTDDDRLAKAACDRFLSHHVPEPPGTMLRRLAEHPAAQAEPDAYGAGGAVAMLESRTASLLGKPAALFFIKGVTAQLSVLRAHCDAARTPNLAIHPMSHLDFDEANAIERVGGARAIRLGRHAPFGVRDLDRLTEPLAAVVVELPLRRAGYLLPPIDELRAIADWCRVRAVPLHFDGARLWEAAAGYGIPLAELAALADSVYVSFYKGLGGLGGAVVAGTEAFLRSLAPWKTRFGGDLSTAYPYAIAAIDGLDRRLPRMPDFVDRARALAARLANNPALIVNPPMPQVNAFQILLRGTPSSLAQRSRALARSRGIWLFSAFSEAAINGYAIAEITIGDAADLHHDDEVVSWIAEFVAMAEGGAS
jgi:threonine aldolase